MGSLHTTRLNKLKIGKETTWGTPVAPTGFIKETGFSGDMAYETIESKSHTGSRTTPGVFRVAEMGNLSVPFEADSDNLGWMLKAALGSEAAPAAQGTGAYKHTFTPINSSALPSWTFEAELGGYKTVRKAGAVCNSLALEITPKAIVTGSADFVYKSEADQGSPVSLTPPTVRPFVFADGSVKVDTVSIGEIKSLSLNVQNNLSTEDYRLGGAGALASLPAGEFRMGGSLVAVFNADSVGLKDKLKNNTAFALEITLDTGIVIGTTTVKLIVSIPSAMFSGVTVETGGEFLELNAEFAAYGASPVSIDLHNERATAY